jgi:hypothetical protein
LNDPFDAPEGQQWLGVVVSLPNSRLMLPPDEFQKWRQKEQRDGNTPIENPRRLKVFSKDDFVLVQPTSEASPAKLVSGKWPDTAFVSQNMSQTRTVNFLPEDRQSIVLAWLIPEEAHVRDLSVRFRGDEPVRLPELILRAPTKSLVPK